MKHLFTLLLGISFTTLVAQDFRYGKISKEEVLSEKSQLEPDAAAEVIYETSVVNLEYSISERKFKANKTVEGRIKIYDKNRADDELLKIEIPLYISGSDREKTIEFKAATANLENGKVVSTRVRNADIFSDRKNKYWETKTLTFPNVQN